MKKLALLTIASLSVLSNVLAVDKDKPTHKIEIIESRRVNSSTFEIRFRIIKVSNETNAAGKRKGNPTGITQIETNVSADMAMMMNHEDMCTGTRFSCVGAGGRLRERTPQTTFEVKGPTPSTNANRSNSGSKSKDTRYIVAQFKGPTNSSVSFRYEIEFLKEVDVETTDSHGNAVIKKKIIPDEKISTPTIDIK